MPIAGFIADLACVEARLVVEVYDGQHAATIEEDRIRSDAIEAAAYLVIRFWNDDVLRRIDTVMDEIDRVLAASMETLR
jgi:very-short-patch-repair endonuclease